MNTRLKNFVIYQESVDLLKSCVTLVAEYLNENLTKPIFPIKYYYLFIESNFLIVSFLNKVVLTNTRNLLTNTRCEN